jgi:hypothetical protein
MWRVIAGWPAYAVSRDGRVKRIVRAKRNGRIRIMKQYPVAENYRKVILCKDGTSRQTLVHRLVAESFIPNPHNLPTVNHKKSFQNNVGNLEWASRSRQIVHAQLTGLKPAKGYYKTAWGWRVQIKPYGKKSLNIGTFNTLKEAKAARAAAVKIYQSLENTI